MRKQATIENSGKGGSPALSPVYCQHGAGSRWKQEPPVNGRCLAVIWIVLSQNKERSASEGSSRVRNSDASTIRRVGRE
jgi:hypothetical protein